MGIGIAIVGATGNVGREMLNVLDESDISIEQVFAVASNKSKGKTKTAKLMKVSILITRVFDNKIVLKSP